MVSIHRVPVDVLLIISVVCFIFRFKGGHDGHPLFFLHLSNCIKRAILRLLAVAQSGAYQTYVSICDARQTPKEPF